MIRPVRLVEVQSLNQLEKVYPAVVSADQYSNLAFKKSGPLVEMNVDEGQTVRKGQIVAVMDPKDFALDLQAKKASFLNAQSQMERSKKLLEKNAVSIQEFEMKQATFINAKSAYEIAQSTFEDTKLRAPFDGFIQKKYVENYQRVQSGQQIVCLINPEKLQVQFTIPETNIVYFNAPNSIYVEFDTYKGKYFKAEVKEFVKASPDGSGVPVYLKISDPEFNLKKYKISVGFSCRVAIQIENVNRVGGVGVPLTSLVLDNMTGNKTVFVYNENESTVKQLPVTSDGFIFGRDKVAVQGDLKEGDRIVDAGATMLVDGQKVKVLTE